MIDETLLRDDLIQLLTATEKNIRTRCVDESAIHDQLEERYNATRELRRTGMTFSAWREDEITQAGVAWLLACVFVRFLEDSDLLREVYLAGPGSRLKAGQDRRTLWYRKHPDGNDREYLLDIFSKLVHLPGLKGLFDRTHNPLWSLGPDGDGAKALWDFFQAVDPDTQVLRHDFTDTAKSTRFLGDLYQNVSKSARKRYALLQTPDFVVDFILDHTLEPALKEVPLDGFRLIDPACGSGHFLLAAFERLFRLWANRDGDLVALTQRTLDCVYGVDLNPYAAAIARFRLLVAALRACSIMQLDRAPDWEIHIATGDSLLFGPNKMVPSMVALASEDPEQLRLALQSQGYHVVVGNPPYINVDDPELRRRYRTLYKSCSRNYQLSVPFMECFFNLAENKQHVGFVGLITSNGFMTREFGITLVEKYIPMWDISVVIDTSAAYIPGHNTSTVILWGRHQRPVSTTVRFVRPRRGGTGIPDDPSNAPAWSSIVRLLNEPGIEDEWVTVIDETRSVLGKHPWSVGGHKAIDIKRKIENITTVRLAGVAAEYGWVGMSHADELMVQTPKDFWRWGIPSTWTRDLIDRDAVKHWGTRPTKAIFWPYNAGLMEPTPPVARWLWPFRTTLGNRATFGQSTYAREGRPWWAWHQVTLSRSTGLRMCYGEISTHNHFVCMPPGSVATQTAPIFKLPDAQSKTDLVGLTGFANSSLAAFWMRQACTPKGGDQTGSEGARVRKSAWQERIQFNVSAVSKLPIPTGRPQTLAEAILSNGQKRSHISPSAILSREVPSRALLDSAREASEELLDLMISLQEELDWHVYDLFGLWESPVELPLDSIPPTKLGMRAFEIQLLRRDQGGPLDDNQSRQKAEVSNTLPAHWAESYKSLIENRIAAIDNLESINAIEKLEYKRRWNVAPWTELEQQALRNWLLDRLEDPRYWASSTPTLTSVARLADALRKDNEFLQVAELYLGRPDFDLAALTQDLVLRESVPFLPVLRYKDSGLRKRADWERTWEVQRLQDAGEKIDVPPPPMYAKEDFLSIAYWRHRGELDCGKERFISYPYLERDSDKSPVVTWAGYNFGEQALALAGYANEMRINEGWPADRLIPVIAGLEQLQPWLDQWHNEIDPDRQQRLNESIRTFVESEMTQLGITTEKIREWGPPARVSSTKPRKTRARTTAARKSPAPTE